MRQIFLILIAALGLATRASSTEKWETIPAPTVLQASATQGHVTHEGARIWYAQYGSGSPVILLHGGLVTSETWGNLAPILAKRHQVILIDSRGHGRSELGTQALSYRLLASDVLAVMDELRIRRADIVGWSDGGITGLELALNSPTRVLKVVAYAANADLSGVDPGATSAPIFKQFGSVAAADYRRLSPTPEGFGALAGAVRTLWSSQPNYTAADLGKITAPVLVVVGERDEGIRRAHTEYLARTIPNAELSVLPAVSHFAHLQDPAAFNDAVVTFLDQSAEP